MSAECPRCGHDIWDDCTNCAKDAEIDRLRAELAGFKAELTHIEAVNDDLEEIIARVRELCENAPELVGFHVTLPGSVSVAAVLAALEGNQP